MTDSRPTAAFAVRDGALACEGVPLEDIARQHGTPTYVYSRAAIESAWRGFADACAGRDALVCYAMKANSNLAVIDVLARLGAGFDIVSGGELARVLAAGGQPSKIVFSGVGKTAAEIEAALAAGIGCFNVESEPELERIDAVARRLGVRAPVSLRVNPDVDAGTHPYISTGLRDNKFGIAHDRAPEVYARAAQLAGIEVVGIDCHIGSQITELSPFLDALDRVLALADEIRARSGIVLHHLDLGGGLGIRYRDETPPARGELLRALFERIDAWVAAGGNAGRTPRTMFEFGRALVAECGVLLTKVEYLKRTEAKRFAIVDAAMNDLMRPTLYDAYHPVNAVRERTDVPAETFDLVGPVCESGDWLARERTLALAEGDLLAIGCAGAYGFAMASNYNTRGRAAEVMVDGDAAHVVRERETVESLFAGERRLPR